VRLNTVYFCLCGLQSKIGEPKGRINHRSRRRQLQMSDVDVRMEGKNSSCATFMQEPASSSLLAEQERPR
jgi:hypothetical protein